MIERHQLLVTAMTFGAPIDRSERLVFDENEVAADLFGPTAGRTLDALRDGRYSQTTEKGRPILIPDDPTLPAVSFAIPDSKPSGGDLAIEMADLLAQSMDDLRRVRLGREHEGIDPGVRRACIARIARAVADGLIDPTEDDRGAWANMRQSWSTPGLEFAMDLANAWNRPMLNVMDGYHVLSTVPLPADDDPTRSITIHVDAVGRSLWSVMPTRIFFDEGEVPQGLDLLRVLVDADR